MRVQDNIFSPFLDPAITLFEDGNVRYKAGIAVSIPYTITLRNEAKAGAAAGNRIPNVTSPTSNFRLQMQFSDIDMRAKIDTVLDKPITIAMSSLDETRALDAQTEFNTSGTHLMTLDPTKCSDINFICALLTVPSAAIYIDVNNGSWSNIRCQLIANRKSCSPGEYIKHNTFSMIKL